MPSDQYHGRPLDPSTANIARVYNWLCGGDSNYTVDQVFGAQLIELNPYVRVIACDNRDFVARAARHMAQAGVDQFIDFGSGIPAYPNVHEIVRAVNPRSRVVYVDFTVEAVVETAALIRGLDGLAAIEADARRPDTVVDHPVVGDLIDRTKPVGAIFAALLHFFAPEDDPVGTMRRYVDWLPTGSMVAISHVSADDAGPEIKAAVAKVEAHYRENAGEHATVRSREEFASFFDGLNLLDPGIAYVVDWRPDGPVDLDSPARPCQYAGVARKIMEGGTNGAELTC